MHHRSQQQVIGFQQSVRQPHNKQLQRTVRDKVPRHIPHRAARWTAVFGVTITA